MAYEKTIEINNSTWTEVSLQKGSYYIEAVDPSTVIEYSLDSNGQNAFTITSGSAQYTLDTPKSLYFKASSLFNGKTTKVYINDYSTKASAPLAAPQAKEINITNQWTQLSLGAGSYFIIPEAGSLIVSMSLSSTGDNSKALKRGGEQVSLNAPASLYFKLNTEDNKAQAQIRYNTVNVIASTGTGGGGGGGGGTTYTFNAPLTETNGVVSLSYGNGINVTNGQLVADIANNTDFQALKLEVTNNKSELQKLETSVNTNKSDIVVLKSDVSTNKTSIQNLTTELNKTVKLTDNQSISGIKTFVSSPVVPTPANDTDAANKSYVDTTINNNTLTFQGALNKQGNNVSIGLENDIVLNTAGDKLTLNLNANTDFNNVKTGLEEAKKIATYTSVGRVMPKEHDFVISGTTGELSLDLTSTGTLKQNFVDLATQQTVDGEKDFVKEVKAKNLTTRENGNNYGSVDIRNQDGYYSISRNGTGQAVDILMELGFVDSNTNLRIRNKAGGVVTFNTLAQYESTLTPSDDKDLVNLAYVRRVKEELKVLIQSLQGGLHFVGVISNSKQECETDNQLLNQFVQTEEHRAPRNGDFVKTNDNYGFIYNGTSWVNFGQVSISIATTTQAGIMMFGTTDGELQDLGNGKAKVIGWDTVKQALIGLDGRITTNTQSITQNTQAIGQTVKLTGNQTVAGNKVFTSKVEINADNEVLKLKNTSNTANYIAGYEGNTRIYYIGKDSLNSTDLSIKNEYSVNGWITLKTKSKFDQAYTITDNEQIVHKKYVDDTINTNCVKLTGNQDIAGNKKFIDYVDVDTAPTTTYPFMLRFVGDKWSSGQSADLIRFHKFGGVCGYKVYLNGTGFNYAEIWGSTLISNMKDPTSDSHGANKRYVDGKVTTLTNNTVSLTGDQSIGGVKDFTGTILSSSSNRTYGSNRYYSDNDASGLGTPVFNTFGTKTEKQASIGFTDASNQGKFEIKIENLNSRPNPKIALSNNTEINGTLNVTEDITAPNMPIVLPAGTQPTTANIGSMKVCFVLK